MIECGSHQTCVFFLEPCHPPHAAGIFTRLWHWWCRLRGATYSHVAMGNLGVVRSVTPFQGIKWYAHLVFCEHPHLTRVIAMTTPRCPLVRLGVPGFTCVTDTIAILNEAGLDLYNCRTPDALYKQLEAHPNAQPIRNQAPDGTGTDSTT